MIGFEAQFVVERNISLRECEPALAISSALAILEVLVLRSWIVFGCDKLLTAPPAESSAMCCGTVRKEV